MLTIEDYAPKVKKAQRNLVDREALMIRKESNKQEAKELAQSIDNSNDSPDRIEPELNQLKAKRAELEKELEKVKTVIEEHESNLACIPDTIKQKRQEMSMLFDC
jgi:predicted  nucleic acid-binding Zn-ribbon protein